MANLMTVRLNRGDSPNLGFRLQGGKDFGTPLVIQKVNGGSPAERAGLIAGDAVIKINNTDVFNLRHKDAQDVVVRAGPSFEVTIQRGGSTWKPSVVPTGSYSSPTPSINHISPVTRTSLAATKSENIGAIGTGHNSAAKPFGPPSQVNGSLNGGPKLINKQYNTPVKLYSEESIAETLSAQTEVLSTGALGVNFKKNEKNYDASNSAVLRMLKESENDLSPQEEGPENSSGCRTISLCISPGPTSVEPDSGVTTAPISGVAGLRHVTAPENRSAPANPPLPPGQNICADCERLIVGVFVRIKDKNLHVDCFKCSTCGTSLKNVGYYSINNKLYCDIHAKAAAIKNNPNPNLLPVTVPPSIKVPAHTISSALSSHPSASPTQLSPRANNSGPTFQAPNISGPKPFSSVNAPLSTKKAPLSPVAPSAPSPNNSYSTPNYSPVSVTACPLENIVWPPPHDLSELPTACPLFYPPPSQVENQIHSKRSAELEIEAIIGNIQEQDDSSSMSRFYSPKPIEYSPGDKKSAMACREAISGYLETQRLVENIVSTAAQPAEIELHPLKASNPPCLRDITEEACCQQKEICDSKHVANLPNPNRKDSCVPLKWESPLTQAIRTTAPDADTFSQIPSRYSGSPLATALAVAPSEPFTPTGTHCEEVPLPEETVPYFPPAWSGRNEQEDVTKPPETQSDSRAVSGTPPQRRKKKKDPTDKYFEDLPKPQETLSLRTALTTAPERPYSPLIIESSGTMEAAMKDNGVDRSQFQRPTEPEVLPSSFQMNKKEPKPPSYYSPVVLERKIEETCSEENIQQSDTRKNTTIQNSQVEHEDHVAQNFPPLFQGFSCSFQNKTGHSQFSVEVKTTPPVMSPPPHQIIKKLETTSEYVQEEHSIEDQCELHHTSKKVEKKETQERAKQEELMVTREPVQPVHLHKPEHLPQYQVEITAEAEAELLRLQKMQKAQSRSEQQKQQASATQLIAEQQPTIKIESEVESRPGCITQSLTNKLPPVIPYYQANLVPQHMSAPTVHLFDPKSPDISRSPSPCLGRRERSCSPGAQVRSNMRVVSPAPDPPRSSSETAQQPKQMYQMLMKTRSYAQPMEQSRLGTSVMDESVIEQNDSFRREQTLESHRFDSSKDHKAQKFVSQSGDTSMSTSVEEQSRQAHMEQLKKSQVESVERSKDGSTQIQRKKIVTEEFERHQKETNIQIEKNVTITKRLPFHEVNASSVDRDSLKGHVTDPRPFLQSTGGQKHHQQLPNASSASTKHAFARSSNSLLNLSNKPNQSSVSPPETGTVSGRQTGGVSVAPKRGRGVLNAASLAGARIPLCGSCNMQIRGPFITALGKIWCPNHFICVTPSCKRPLQDMGFVEEHGQLYCEICFEQYLAPPCSKCSGKIRGDCLKAIGKNFHPECFNCTYCSKLFGNSPFFLEDGSPYCETDWNELFTTKCFACGFPVEAGDRWVEALNNNYHSQCFNCTMCKKNLEGQSFFAKGGRPFCKNHAR